MTVPLFKVITDFLKKVQNTIQEAGNTPTVWKTDSKTTDSL